MKQTNDTHLKPLAAPVATLILALGLAACGPMAGEPIPGSPESPIGPERVGGPPPPLTPDTDPVER